MLVLSRREADRIVFPSIGVSVEVIKLTRSRATIGVRAPKNLRVLRYELVDDLEAEMDRDDEFIAAIKNEAVCQLKSDVNAAIEEVTRRLDDARELLKVDDGQAAYDAIAVAIAELERLNESRRTDNESKSEIDPWELPQGVAESASSYQVNRKEPARRIPIFCDDDSRLVENPLFDSLAKQGFRFGTLTEFG